MARVSLILPISHGATLSVEQIQGLREGLEAKGHTVDVVGVADPRSAAVQAESGSGWRSVIAKDPGLASSAFAGLSAARGDVFVILDPSRGYEVEDVDRVIGPVVRNEAELAIASSLGGEGDSVRRGPLSAGLGALSRRVIGSSDPFSRLVALAPSLARRDGFAPVGSRFTLELLVRSQGRRSDVAIPKRSGGSRGKIMFDDIRHIKRLSDHRFGNLSRLFQFCVVGASGMVVDLSCYAFFQWVFSKTWLAEATAPLVGGPLALAVAGALSIGLALTWNFSLNRRLTFSYARRGSLVRQYVTYALSNALGILLSLFLRLILPGQLEFFQQHKLAAAVVGIVAATGISFSMSRWFVFSRRSVALDQERSLATVPLASGLAPEPHVTSLGHSSSSIERI